MKSLFRLSVIAGLCAITLASAKAQVTIGSNEIPNKDAVLDLISNANKGLLLPRVALTATNLATPLSNHVAGMTVYNTATNGTGSIAVNPGIYLNDGSKWIRMANDNAQTQIFVNDTKLKNIKLQNKSDGQPREVDNQFVITDNGLVGIGTDNPTGYLSIKNTISLISRGYNDDPTISINTDRWVRFVTNGTGIAFHGSKRSSTLKWPDIFIQENGFVGISRISPTAKLDIDGDLRFSTTLKPNGNPGIKGQILTSMGPKDAPVWRNNAPIKESYSNVVNSEPLITKFKTTEYYPVTIGLDTQNVFATAQVDFNWVNQNNFWSCRFNVNQITASGTCTINVLWIPY